MIGTTIASRFRILSELGRGGFSKTFIAQDCHLPGHPKCVIKQLEPPTTDSLILQITQRMFDREAQVLYKLGKHDQIPQLLAHFGYEKKFYLAIELIDGKVLSQEIYDGCRHDETYVLQLLQDTLQTLAFVHDQNVIHRDIKPSNLIRRSLDQKLVLIDFGAVKEVAIQPASDREPTKQTVAIGSHGYMPDEQANGRPKFASDLYSLGMVCIQALTGISPKNLAEDLKSGEILWHHLAPQASEELKAFLDKLVRSHFTQRFETAREAIASFHQIFTDIPALEVSESVKASYIPSAHPNEPSDSTIYYGQPLQANSSNLQTVPILNSSRRLEADTINFANSDTKSEVSPTIPAHLSADKKNNLTKPKTRFLLFLSLIALLGSAIAAYFVRKKCQKTRLFVFLSLATLSGSAIGAYFVWENHQTDQRHAQTVAVMNSLLRERNYQECLSIGDAIPVTSPHFTSAKLIIDNCQKELKNQTAQQNLAEAKRLIADKKYDQALVKLRQISPDTTSYQQALEQTEILGKELLKIATNTYQNQGRLDEAIKQLETIPETVPSGKSARQLIPRWRNEWEANTRIKSDIDRSVRAREWQRVINLRSRLTTNHWRNLQEVQQAVRNAESALRPPVINRRTRNAPRARPPVASDDDDDD